MQSNSTNPPEKEVFNAPQVIIPTDILLSLATGPLLLGVLCGKATQNFMQSLGEASEEIFRGDRLPAIKFPDISQKED